MATRRHLWKIIPTAAVGAAFTLSPQVAQAFFPPIPVGSDPVTVSPPPPPPVIPVTPTIPVPPVEVPPVPPPPFVPPPPLPTERPTENPCTCEKPQVVPEPATIISGLIGLSVLGGAAWRKRKKSN